MAFAVVPEGEGEHPVQAREAVDAPRLVGAQEHFAVAVAAELEPQSLEFGAQFQVVVNLAVEDHGKARQLIDEGLVRGGREVDDRQSRVAEPDPGSEVRPFAVRPAVPQSGHHGVYQPWRDRFGLCAKDACEATHAGQRLPCAAEPTLNTWLRWYQRFS